MQLLDRTKDEENNIINRYLVKRQYDINIKEVTLMYSKEFCNIYNEYGWDYFSITMGDAILKYFKIALTIRFEANPSPYGFIDLLIFSQASLSFINI